MIGRVVKGTGPINVHVRVKGTDSSEIEVVSSIVVSTKQFITLSWYIAHKSFFFIAHNSQELFYNSHMNQTNPKF